MVNTRDVITPEGVWALVVPRVQVVAPFIDVEDVGRCAAELGLGPDGYTALPFLGLGLIAVL